METPKCYILLGLKGQSINRYIQDYRSHMASGGLVFC